MKINWKTIVGACVGLLGLGWAGYEAFKGGNGDQISEDSTYTADDSAVEYDVEA